MVNSMREFTYGCFHNSSSVEKWTALAMDYIVSPKTYAILSSFLANFAISSNVLASLCINCCCNYNNNQRWNSFNTIALILTKIK
jgi:hypothetical protein